MKIINLQKAVGYSIVAPLLAHLHHALSRHFVGKVKRADKLEEI
jgi:hypothetical protein